MSYHDIAARRYALAESRPDSFSLRLAPRLIRLFDALGSSAQPPRLLDVGAGTGQLADVLRAAGFATVSLDRSLPMLRHRIADRSGNGGPAVAADATALPLSAVGPRRFDLITATFNVLNHLPNLGAVEATVHEVGRLLAADGLFVFDINTRVGLEATGRTTVHESGPTGDTTWTREWIGPDTLRLRAQGTVVDGDSSYVYDETIDKIVVEPGDLERMCAAAGVGPVAWRSDDLVTSIEHPEQHAVVFGIAGPTA